MWEQIKSTTISTPCSNPESGLQNADNYTTRPMFDGDGDGGGGHNEYIENYDRQSERKKRIDLPILVYSVYET